jgi:predicted aldo/keto reductase-like oxidoreductase
MKKLGFGLMRLPKIPGGNGKDIDKAQTADMVDRFLERGFSYFDTAFVYDNGESEKTAGEVLVGRYPRDKFQLATKLPIWDLKKKEEMQEIFDIQLERTGAKYFDNYLIHGINKGNAKVIEECGAWDHAKSLKERGLARHIGFSFHSTADHLDEVFDKHPEAEFVQIQLNYADWESKEVQSRLCYEVAVKYGKKVLVMEPVRGGALAAFPPEIREIFFRAAPDKNLASWALRFVGSLPQAEMVLSGMSDMSQLLQNMDTFDNMEPLTAAELAVIAEALEALSKIPTVPCTACKYCVDSCPEKIGIPGLIKLYNDYYTYRNLDSNKRRYDMVTGNGGKASSCIKCGECERHCPQNIPIRDTLEKVAKVFE